MSLKDAINNTNIQKENVKTVANKIDNKLVELGGERATDLNDVPNKILNLTKQYRKCAIGTFEIVYKKYGNTGNSISLRDHPIKVPMNLDFIPKFIFAQFDKNSTLHLDVDNVSAFCISDMSNGGFAMNGARIRNITKNSFEIYTHEYRVSLVCNSSLSVPKSTVTYYAIG